MKAIIAVDADKELISELDCEGVTVIHHMDEEDIKADIEDADIVIADPMYKPIAPNGCEFIDMPTESFSGRIYRRDIIDVVSDFSPIRSKI